MTVRRFKLSNGQEVEVDDADSRLVEALRWALKDNGLTAQEVGGQSRANPMDSIVGMAKDEAVKRGINAVTGSGGSNVVGSILESTPATQTAFNAGAMEGAPALAQTEGANAIFNAGATEATTEAGASAGGLFSAPYAGPAGLAGVYGISRAEDLRYGGAKGALAEGASGALAGYAVGGPVGAIIGGGIGAVRGWTHGPSHTQKEQKDRAKLAALGINVDNAGTKEWELNDKFKGSRKESDLTGNDIKNAASLYLRYGKDYSNLSNSQRAAIGQAALDRNLVREHQGRIDVSYDSAFDDAVKKIMATPVAKSSSGSQNNSKRKASPRDDIAPTQNAPVTVAPGEVIKGPATTVDAGGPSPYQPELIAPDEYMKRYRDMLAQRGYKGLQ